MISVRVRCIKAFNGLGLHLLMPQFSIHKMFPDFIMGCEDKYHNKDSKVLRSYSDRGPICKAMILAQEFLMKSTSEL